MQKLLRKIVESKEAKSTAKYSIFQGKTKTGGSWEVGRPYIYIYSCICTYIYMHVRVRLHKP